MTSRIIPLILAASIFTLPLTAQSPAPEMQSLAKSFAGEWSLEVHMEPSSEMPGGFTGSGHETWRSGPAGLTLVEEETIAIPGQPMSLLGVLWWDRQANAFHGMECNNFLPYVCDLKGALNDITISWDGKQLVLYEWETHGAKRSLWRESWTDITATSYTQIGESGDGTPGSFHRVMTIHATRPSTH